jgi:hypothetical protein
LALSWPLIIDRLPPVTRLRRAAAAPGCVMSTAWPAPMLKSRQSMMARDDVWVIARVVASGVVIVAAPATT